MEAHDYVNNRAYRWTSPSWQNAYNEEAKHRGVRSLEAWDEVDYVELESIDDFFEKGQAIYLGEDYDTRVSIPLDIPEEDLMLLFRAAHERDLTFNQFVEEALKEAIKELERDPEGFKQRAERWKNEKGIL